MSASPRRIAWLAIALGWLWACGAENRAAYQVDGTVVEVMAASGQVKIAHDDIPDLMPAMTMSFDVAPELLSGVERGSRVRFELERRPGTLRIVSLDVIGRAEVSARRVTSGPALRLEEPAPEFALTDQNGATLALADLRGRAVLLDFVFTRCEGPCPILTAAHVHLQRMLPPELAARTRFLSVSIDPAYDTPERLRAYAEARGADLAGWSFLTGTPDEVAQVLRGYHVGTLPSEDGMPEHVIVTYLIDAQGRIARRYLGLEHAAEDLLRDLREAL